MDLQYIPKTFWHALSAAVLIVSTGLTYIAYQSSTISIELANAKINLSSEVTSSRLALNDALDEAQKAKEDAQARYEELYKQHQLLQRQLKSLEQKAQTNQSLRSSLDHYKKIYPSLYQQKPLPKLEFKKFDDKVLNVQRSLKSLERLNREIQPMQK
jgi:DNA repair exonuclease SbcCD ATPase subunit